MSTASKNHQLANLSEDEIVEHVYGIIDSKFQYLRFNTNNLIRDHLRDCLVPSPDGIEGQVRTFEKTINKKIEQNMLNHIEDYSKTTRLLLFLRNCVCSQNAKLIFDLLTEDIFLNFSEREIKIIIEGRKVRY